MVLSPTVGLKSSSLCLSFLRKFAPPPWSEGCPQRRACEEDLPADDVARRIDQLVDELDLQGLYASYAGRGQKAHRPDLLLRVVLYESHCGRQSPAQWAQDMRRNTVVQWLARGLRPAQSVLYEFRDRLASFLPEWHRQVVAAIQQACRNRGVDVTDSVTLDGTSMEACASRHKMVCLDTVDKRLELLDHLPPVDSHEETLPTEEPTLEPTLEPAKQPKWLARTDAGRQRQKARLQQAKQRLQQQLAKNARRPKDKRLPRKHVRVSITDPEAASGRDKHNVYRPLYNVQLVWSLVEPVVLSFAVFSEHGDHGMLPTLVDNLMQQTGCKPKKLLVDSAYTSADDLAFCQVHGIELLGPWQANDFTKDRPALKEPAQLPKSKFVYDAERDEYRCPQGHAMPFEEYKYKRRADAGHVRYRLYRCPPKHCRACPLKASCAKLPHKGRTLQRHPQQELIDGHQQRMATPAARLEYRQRGQGERPFADLKVHRNLRRLNGRGHQRANTQMALTILAHNLGNLNSTSRIAGKHSPSNPSRIPA